MLQWSVTETEQKHFPHTTLSLSCTLIIVHSSIDELFLLQLNISTSYVRRWTSHILMLWEDGTRISLNSSIYDTWHTIAFFPCNGINFFFRATKLPSEISVSHLFLDLPTSPKQSSQSQCSQWLSPGQSCSKMDPARGWTTWMIIDTNHVNFRTWGRCRSYKIVRHNAHMLQVTRREDMTQIHDGFKTQLPSESNVKLRMRVTTHVCVHYAHQRNAHRNAFAR